MVYTDFLSRQHGYVALATGGAFLMNMYLSVKVMQARKKFKVAYPAMYSDKEEQFNCVQRAHQNTLEGIPFYLSLLWAGGLRHPLPASICGAIYIVGRLVYAIGYSTGKPELRVPGALFSMFGGMMPLLGMTISTGAGLLGWW